MKSLRVIQHKDIDRALFNQCVNRYSKNDLYAQDFVWDALHPKWDLLIFGDYKALVPLPTKRKMGLVSYRQPIFIRTIPVIGDIVEEELNEILKWFEENGSLIHLNLNLNREVSDNEKGIYQLIQLNEAMGDYRSRYSSNVKRILKKQVKNLNMNELKDVDFFISFFRDHVGSKHKQIKDKSYAFLYNWISSSINKGIGKIKAVTIDNQIVCMAFVIDFRDTRYYIKGASSDLAKKCGAMTHLLDQLITEAHKEGFKKFDFVGSNDSNLILFNKKFGASMYHYEILKRNNLLWPLNKLISP